MVAVADEGEAPPVIGVTAAALTRVGTRTEVAEVVVELDADVATEMAPEVVMVAVDTPKGGTSTGNAAVGVRAPACTAVALVGTVGAVGSNRALRTSKAARVGVTAAAAHKGES